MKFQLLSRCYRVKGTPKIYQPVLFEGSGRISFEDNVTLGVPRSPDFYTGYIYIDARKPSSVISFGRNVSVNNNCYFISEGEGIFIGDNSLIGLNCQIIDSDFHNLDPKLRLESGNTKRVNIGKNVFLGSNVKVLKGVEIGNNTMIANGSVVTKDIPNDVVAAGIPAKVIKLLSTSL